MGHVINIILSKKALHNLHHSQGRISSSFDGVTEINEDELRGWVGAKSKLGPEHRGEWLLTQIKERGMK
jgi:hypothetical protein